MAVALPRSPPKSRQGLGPAATDPTRVQDAPSSEDTLLTPPARCTQEFGDSTALKLFGFKLTQSGRCEKRERERKRSIYTFSTTEGGDARQSGVPCARGRPAPPLSAGHGGGAPAHPAPPPRPLQPQPGRELRSPPPHGGQPSIRAPGARPPSPPQPRLRPRAPPRPPAAHPDGEVSRWRGSSRPAAAPHLRAARALLLLRPCARPRPPRADGSAPTVLRLRLPGPPSCAGHELTRPPPSEGLRWRRTRSDL